MHRGEGYIGESVEIFCSRFVRLFTRLFFIFSCLFLPVGFSNAETLVPQSVQPQEVSYEVCNKMFAMNSQKLFFMTLASINANRFVVDEIQSTSGYILFTANKKQFLANVITVDAKNSLLKITPCDNNYIFPPAIVLTIYKYIELNLQTPLEKVYF